MSVIHIAAAMAAATAAAKTQQRTPAPTPQPREGSVARRIRDWWVKQ